MRVLLLSDFYPPYSGGVEHHVTVLAHGLADRGHTVQVVTLQGPLAQDDSAEDGLVVHRIRGSIHRASGLFAQPDRPWAPPLPDPELARSIRSAIRDFAPDVIHGHDWLLRSALPVAGDIPVVSTLHYYTRSCAKKNLLRDGAACPGPSVSRCVPCTNKHYGRLKGPAILAASRLGAAWERHRTEASIAVSAACGIANDGSAAQLEIIANCPTVGEIADEFTALPTGEFILYVGDLRPEKGVPVLLDAYDRLEDPPPLVVIGGGDPPPINQGSDISFLGERPHSQVLHAFSRCLFSVIPSIWNEPFGLVGLEAMAAGRPVVASRIGGITDFVRDEENGLLVSPGNAADLADAMSRMLGDTALQNRLATAAVATALEFSPERMVGEVEEVYKATVA